MLRKDIRDTMTPCIRVLGETAVSSSSKPNKNGMKLTEYVL